MKRITLAEAQRMSAQGMKFRNGDGSELDLGRLAQKKPSLLARILSEIARALERISSNQESAIEATRAATAQVARQQPPIVNVETKSPIVNVQTPERSHCQWKFQIERDTAGRITNLTATPIE